MLLGCPNTARVSLALAGTLLVALFNRGEIAAQDVPIPSDPDRTPVLLVPGWGDAAEEVSPLRRRLLDAGWPPAHISTLTFTDSFGSNEDHWQEVSEAVDRLRRLSGGDRVDVVAHSMGGLAVRRFLDERGDKVVRRIVFLGTPHMGTMAAVMAWGDGAREMIPGSDFLNRLSEIPVSPRGVEMLAIRSPLDLVVIPGSSAILPGAENVEVCCPTHQGLLDDAEAFQRLERFLLHGD